MNRKVFYDQVRSSLFKGALNATQVRTMEAMLDEWERQKLTNLAWLAYMFATVYHETARTMAPVEEGGKGKGRKYGLRIKMNGRPYMDVPHIFYGRGLVQLTWYENYQLMGRLLGVDLLHHPELALDLNIAIRILFEGMLKGASSFGDFTGKCLEMYFTASIQDWKGARKIINGNDCADLVAGYGQKFYAALNAAAV